MELELVEELLGLGRAHLVDELVVGAGHFVDRIHGLAVVHVVLALVQHGHAVVLLAQVGEVEVGGERARQQLGVVQLHVVDGLDGLRKPVLIRVRIVHHVFEVFGAGLDRVAKHGVEGGQQLGIELAQHVAQNMQAQIHVLLKGIGKIALLGTLGPQARRHYRGIGGRDLLIIGICHQTSFAKPPVVRSACPPRLLRSCVDRPLRTQSPWFNGCADHCRTP